MICSFKNFTLNDADSCCKAPYIRIYGDLVSEARKHIHHTHMYVYTHLTHKYVSLTWQSVFGSFHDLKLIRVKNFKHTYYFVFLNYIYIMKGQVCV